MNFFVFKRSLEVFVFLLVNRSARKKELGGFPLHLFILQLFFSLFHHSFDSHLPPPIFPFLFWFVASVGVPLHKTPKIGFHQQKGSKIKKIMGHSVFLPPVSFFHFQLSVICRWVFLVLVLFRFFFYLVVLVLLKTQTQNL